MKYILTGTASVGAYIFNLLKDTDHELIFIDDREDNIQQLPKEALENLVYGDPTDPSVLRQAGIDQVDALAAITDQDDVNLVVSTLAKYEYGVPRVLARINNPDHEWLFNPGMGVDIAVNEAAILGRLLVDEIQSKDAHIVARFKEGGYKLVEFTIDADSPFNQQTIQDLDLPEGILFVLVGNRGSYDVPKGPYRLLEGNEVLALIPEASDPDFQDLINGD